MSILLETQKYNHYKLLKEDYQPRLIEYAITKSGNFMIIENELFDIKLNKSLGFYYESKLLKEDIIKEDWLETIADIAVAGTSAALDITGVGTGAAKAIDFAHALSFIYRGETRNDMVMTILGYFSLSTIAIPAIGSTAKGIIMGIAKNFIGKPIGALIKVLSKNATILKLLPKFKNGIGTLKGLTTQFNTWATKYTWFNKVWEPLGKLFVKGLDDFGKFLDDVIATTSKAAGKTTANVVTKTGLKIPATGLKTLPSGAKAVDASKNIMKVGDDILIRSQNNKNWFLLGSPKGNAVASSNFYKSTNQLILKNGKWVLNTGAKSFKFLPVGAKALDKAGNFMLINKGVFIKNTKGTWTLLSSNAGQMVAGSAKIYKNSGQLVFKNGKWVLKTGSNVGKKALAAAAGLGLGVAGLVSMGFSDDISTDEIKNASLPSPNTDIEQTTGTDNNQTSQKTATKDNLEGKIIDNHDRSWDYMKKGGKYYTRRKGKTNWIHVTPEMKGGKPLKAIRTKVYGETV